MKKEACSSQSWRLIIWCRAAAPLRVKIYQSSAPLRRSTHLRWMSPLKWSLGIRRIQSDDLEHRVGRVLSRFSSRLNWESPTPSPAGECVCTVYSPPPWIHWIHFCMKRLRTLKSSQIFKSEIKKSKTYSVWCSFQGLSNGTTLMCLTPYKILKFA